MKTTVTMVWFPAFTTALVVGKISKEDVDEIVAIRSTMVFDEYAGYSPKERDKYRAILDILDKYDRPIVREL